MSVRSVVSSLRVGLLRRSVYTHTPSVRPSSPSWHNPISDAVSSQESIPAHSPPNPAFNSSGHAPYEAILRPEHYFAAFHTFTDCPSIDPVSVTVSERTYATPRKVYAEMRAHRFRSATEADLLITALRTFVRVEDYSAARVALRAFTTVSPTSFQRAKAKAAVLNSLACRLYLEDDVRQRHLMQYLLGGFSLLESRSTDLEVLLTPWNCHDDNLAATSSMYTRPDLNTVEDDLRPLVFVLFQVQDIRGDKLPRKSLLYRREDKDAAVVLGKFGSDFRFELELNRTEPEVQDIPLALVVPQNMFFVDLKPLSPLRSQQFQPTMILFRDLLQSDPPQELQERVGFTISASLEGSGSGFSILLNLNRTELAHHYAADEMETPRIKVRTPRISALARKARADARSLQDPEIARRLYLDMNNFFRRSL
ncbi:hypothetical protein DFH06DRAFT_1133900 [Mycena polygramma]|nr:hypothetical protein DFH06DRAFT_1133900 [Mycena polygramma]